jgi:hypothetical protein
MARTLTIWLGLVVALIVTVGAVINPMVRRGYLPEGAVGILTFCLLAVLVGIGIHLQRKRKRVRP